MSLIYPLLYQVGFTPWERAATHPAAARHIASLLDREERGRKRPFGKALDLGSGRGHWSLELARRGWEVTGVELARKPLREARQAACAAGIDVNFLRGDVSALREAGAGDGFELFWDFGTLHGLSPSSFAAAARGITAAAKRGAHLLTMVWTPARRGPLPRGLDRAEIEAAFAEWRITEVDAFDASVLPRPLRGVGPRFFRLEQISGS